MIDKAAVPPALDRVGVLLINLGTPEQFSYWPIRRYLKEFLWDRRVIETNRALWWLVLNGIILNTRPRKTARAYEKIWNRERNESPLKTITRAQSEALAEVFRSGGKVSIDWAMRYGQPALGDRLRALRQQGHDRILLVPLYPQYSAATTATALDEAFKALGLMRWQPAIRTMPPYYRDPAYIEALADSMRSHLITLSWKPDIIMASFHGLPQTYVERGDPYYAQCMKTGELLREALGMPDEKFVTVFQSRFGRAEWLKPYADETAIELVRGGCKNLLVVCPGFSADCVETLEEIGTVLKQTFVKHGGREFSLVPCLNASTTSIGMLDRLIRRELEGWDTT
jgi:ferrochelatase